MHGRHPKIGITNFGCILHHSVHVKILYFVICVENYHKLKQTQFLVHSGSPWQSDVRVDKIKLPNTVIDLSPFK
jgi:hypothetical protein